MEMAIIITAARIAVQDRYKLFPHHMLAVYPNGERIAGAYGTRQEAIQAVAAVQTHSCSVVYRDVATGERLSKSECIKVQLKAG